MSSLLYAISEIQTGGMQTTFGPALSQQFSREIQEVTIRRRALEDEMAEYRRRRTQQIDYFDEKLFTSLKDLLWQLYVFLSCAVRQRAPREQDIAAALQPLGFKLVPSDDADPKDLLIVGLAVMAAGVFLIVQASVWVGEFALGALGLQPSPHFPQRAYEPFVWAISALLVQGTAVWMANRMRTRAINDGRWFLGAAGERSRRPEKYVMVAVGCAIAGSVVNFLWATLFLQPSLALVAESSVFALMPAATGGFYAFHLDTVDLHGRQSTPKEIAGQAVLTSFCGLVAVSSWLALKGSAASQELDFTILVALIGLTIGASLGWYIPKAAAGRRPEQRRWADRVQELRAEALKVPGDGIGRHHLAEPPERGAGQSIPALGGPHVPRIRAGCCRPQAHQGALGCLARAGSGDPRRSDEIAWADGTVPGYDGLIPPVLARRSLSWSPRARQRKQVPCSSAS